jgi:hypothetical protein
MATSDRPLPLPSPFSQFGPERLLIPEQQFQAVQAQGNMLLPLADYLPLTDHWLFNGTPPEFHGRRHKTPLHWFQSPI